MAHPDWTVATQEREIVANITATLPNYVPRPSGAYRRWFINHQRRQVPTAPPQVPPTLTEREGEFLETTDDESDDDEDFSRVMAAVGRGTIALAAAARASASSTAPTPAPTPTRKRTLSDCHTIEELEMEMAKLQETFKRHKERLEREESAFPDCPICFDTIDGESPLQSVLASCGHVFCAQCYMRQCSTPLATYTQRCHKCPMCRSDWNQPSNVHIMPKGATVAMCKQKAREPINLT